MCQVGAIYLVVLGLTGGSTAKSVAVLALVLVLVSIFGGAVASSYSKQLQTHAGYFMAADRRISIADKLKSVPMGYFNESSLGQLSGVCTSVVGAIESMVPMVLVNILGGLITTAVFTVIILLFDWRIGLIVLAGILVYLAVVSAMEKKSVAIAAGTQKSQADLTEAVLENVQGMSVIKSFNLSGRGDKKLQGAVEESRRANLAVGNVLTPYTIAQEAVLQLAGVGMMLAAILLWQGGTMTLAKALMVLVMSFMVFNQIKAFGMGVSMLRMAAVASRPKAGSCNPAPRRKNAKTADRFPLRRSAVCCVQSACIAVRIVVQWGRNTGKGASL